PGHFTAHGRSLVGVCQGLAAPGDAGRLERVALGCSGRARLLPSRLRARLGRSLALPLHPNAIPSTFSISTNPLRNSPRHFALIVVRGGRAPRWPPEGAMSELDIFVAALERDDPTERAAYLDQACGADASLRQRLEALLRSHAQAADFMDVPVVEQVAGGGG